MSFNCSSNRPGVAAAHGQHDRKTPLRRFSKNELISGPQALGGQRESTERIIAQWVYARLIEDNVRIREVECLGEMLAKHTEVFVVSRLVLESHIPSRSGFVERIIVLAMDRKGDDCGIVLENLGGSVSLVNVQIADHRARDFPFPLERPYPDRSVISHAQTLPRVGEPVHRAPRQIAAAAP